MPADTNNVGILKRHLLAQADLVGRKLRKKGLKGKTVTLKLKSSEFKQISRNVTLDEATDSNNLIYEMCVKLLENFYSSMKFRLTGVGISNLSLNTGRANQLNLFKKLDGKGKSWEEMKRAVDVIKEKFGKEAIKRGGPSSAESPKGE
ncbi:MAG: hypothetical protein JSV50_13350 [Desulfobacteraceae bacterium]|nr:MAG: hypothetical protein JSV50_13350 [Desulfobacteraceae bacterium]